jgi:hypothetical protein
LIDFKLLESVRHPRTEIVSKNAFEGKLSGAISFWIDRATLWTLPWLQARLLSNYFDQHALAAAAIKLSIENLFPGPEVQFALRDRNNHFPAHHLPFEMRVGIVFAGAIVPIVIYGLVWREFLEPDFVIVQETVLGIIDKNRSGYVHRVDEAKSFLNAAFLDKVLDGVGNVHKSPAAWHLKPQFFPQRFHPSFMPFLAKS